jgi:hypothetical protein
MSKRDKRKINLIFFGLVLFWLVVITLIFMY